MWSRGVAVTAAVCAAALGPLAGAAGAGVLRATSILPPGESGYVSITGVLSGTGSSHLYDQQQPFIDFARKNAMLSQPGTGTAEHPLAGVTITRDSYGVPSITGVTTYDLWYGAGYATAEDRLAELELFRRQTNGTLAEVLGPSYLTTDIEIRRDFYTAGELTQMYSALPAAMQQRYSAYAAGINDYVNYVNTHPTDIPGEFVALGILPSHFSVEDLVAIGVYLARTTPNGDGAELENMQALQSSGPAKFNRILPDSIKGQVATVPRQNGLFPSDPGETVSQQRKALARSSAYLRKIPLPSSSNMGVEYVSGKLPAAAAGVATDSAAGTPEAEVVGAIERRAATAAPAPLKPIHVGGSYMVAVSDLRTHEAIMFNGPELGFDAPEELYEMELHGPGVDVRGVTAPGAPVIAIGHNQNVAWGLTSGLSETNTLYVEQLVPGHPDEYYYKGRVMQMSCQEQTFSYRPEVTSLLDTSTLSSVLSDIGSVTLKLCRTNEGPVQERVGGYVYSRRYAIWGKEIDSLTGLAAIDSATSVRQVGADTAQLTWNENIMAADGSGNIGYWHPGLLPVLSKTWDQRLPMPGNGSAQWTGLLAVKQRPHVIDPKQHWLANWNTLPSQGWTTGNDPASERVAGPFFRGAFLDDLAAHLAKHPTFDGMDTLIEEAGTTAQQRSLDNYRLERAATGAHGGADIVLQTILAWNGDYAAEDATGDVDPGVPAWQDFIAQLQKEAIAPLGAAGQIIGAHGPNDEHLFDVSIGQAYALRTENAAQYRAAAQAAYVELSQKYGSQDPTQWLEPRTMAPESALGAEQPPPLPFFDRGTFEEVTALGP